MLRASIVCISIAVLGSVPVTAQQAGAERPHQTEPEPAPIRSIAERLPEVWQFLQELNGDVGNGALRSNEELIARCRAFYGDTQMQRIEAVVPGWGHMASFDEGKTLWHVNAAMVALLRLGEYAAMSPRDKVVQEWIVLLHDIAKEPVGGRDHRHSFRSGAQAGRLLPALGFPVTAGHAAGFAYWFKLTDGAIRLDAAGRLAIQDNRKLPAIFAGADRLFAEPTRTAILAITLHQSITSLAAWPVAAPISRDQIAALVRPGMVPALRALTLADSGGWNLFDPPTLASMYDETRGIFQGLPRPSERK